MKVSLMRWVVQHPWWVLISTLLLTLLAAQNLQKLELNNDLRSLFGQGNPAYERYQQLEDTFVTGESVMFALHPHDNNVFTRETLSAIEALTERAWQMKGSLRVDSLSNYQHTESVGEDDLMVDYLVRDAETLTDQELQRIRDIALSEKTLVNSVVSEEGHVTSVVVTVQTAENQKDAPIIAEEARQIRDTFRERYPDIDFYLTGTVVFSDAMSKSSMESINRILPYALIAVLISFTVLLRSFTGTFATLVIVGLSTSSAMGLAVWWGVNFQPITMFSPAIILTLAVADCLHILVTYNHEQRRGLGKADAMVESMRINYQPVMLTSVTTAIGFMGLNASESPPFREMGNIVAVGVMIAFVLSLTLLPAIMMIIPSKVPPQKEDRGQKWMEAFARWVIRFRTQLLVGIGILVAMMASLVPLNEFNDVWSDYFDETYDVRRANDFIMKELTGMHRMEVAIPSTGDNSIHELDYLRNLEKFAEWINQQEKVVTAVPFSELTKRLNKTMHAGEASFYKIPESKQLAAQYLLLYEMSLPFGLDLQNQVSFDKSETLFVIGLRDLTSNEVLETSERINAWIKENLPDYMQTQVTGIDVVFSGVGKRNAISMIWGTFMALVVISVCLMIALRSFRYGLISLLPNLLPALTAFGVWGLINGQLDLATSVVTCMTLGVVVDDTVHFLSKYVRARREQHLNAEQAVFYAFKTVGLALVSTSIILVVCFGVQSFSHFGPSASMGILTSITIFLALFVDFLFFVPFLLAVDGYKDSKEAKKEAEKSDAEESKIAA